jgi:integrase/recombinase XerD
VGQGLWERSPLWAKPWRQTALRVPFLFDRTTAGQLIELAGSLPDNSRAPMRGLTYRTIFALLYGLGLRVGKVARLRLGDVNEERQLLVLQLTKFSKSRLVPFGPRLGALLHQYLQARKKRLGSLPSDALLFSFGGGCGLNPSTISQVFHSLIPRLGLYVPTGTAPPQVSIAD